MLRIQLSTVLTSGATAHIEADSPEEAHRALTYLHAIGQLGNAPQTPAKNATESSAPQTTAEAAAVEADVNDAKDEAAADQNAAKDSKPKRTRKPKEEVAPEKSATADKTEKPTSGDKAATAEEAAAAVTAVANAKGLPAARALLTVFGVGRVGELKQDQYAAFIKECGNLIGKDEDAEEDPADLL